MNPDLIPDMDDYPIYPDATCLLCGAIVEEIDLDAHFLEMHEGGPSA